MPRRDVNSELRVDRLLGREVLSSNNQPVGWLEEFRVETRGREQVITEYVIAAAGPASETLDNQLIRSDFRF